MLFAMHDKRCVQAKRQGGADCSELAC